jgi:carboxylesterase
MEVPRQLDPSPFSLAGGPVGLLLIHGFTGAPPEMRLIGDYAHERGYTVSAPCLPGHGTTIEDANGQKWQNWVDHVEKALTKLEDRCERVFAAGLSLGSLLTLYLAAHRPELVGAIAYSPAVMLTDPRSRIVGVLKYLVRQVPKSELYAVDPETESRLWSYDAWPAAATHEVIKFIRQVRDILPQVQCPSLIIYSTADPDIHPDAAQFTYDHIGSQDKELVTLHNCGHCITVDAEWKTVAERTCQFIADRL